MSTIKKTNVLPVPKKSNSTNSKSVVSNGKFVAKKLGANLIATIEGSTERYAKKVSIEEGKLIMDKMAIYNKRPSNAKKQEIIALLTPEAIKVKKEKETLVAKAKGVKQQVKKEIKKSKSKSDIKEHKSLLEQLEAEIQADEAAIPRIQAILDKFKKVEKKAPEPVHTLTPRDGEY